MEPFKVICVTCQAKLSVRNEALIGQIVACPRCSSMVEVARPASAALTAAALESTDSTINLSARQIAEVNEAAADAASTSAAAPPEYATQSATQSPAPPAAPEELAETVPVEVLQASAEVAKYKLITWSLASFVIGATIVGAIVYRNANSPADTTSITSAAPTPGSATSEVEPIQPNAQQTNAEPTAATNEPSPEPQLDADPIAGDSPPEPLTVANAEAETTPSAPDSIEQPEPIEPITPQPQTDEPPTLTIEPAPRMARRFNPLEFDLASLSLDAVDQPREPETQAVDQPEDNPNLEPTADVPAPLEAPAELLSVRIGPSSDETAIQRDAKTQLQLMVPSMQFDDLPLIDALQLVAQLSGQPVSVAPEHLLMAGITSQKKVSLEASDTSLAEVLEKILSPLRLEYETSGPHVIVQRQEASKLREINYPVDDLLSDELSVEQLRGWIEQLVAPNTWQSAGGSGIIESGTESLRVTQPQQVQYQILILLERLRLARNLPPQSRYPVARLAGSPASMVLEDKLAASTTFTFTQLTTLDEIFAHWQTELGAPLLVDWPALAELNRRPATVIAYAIVEEPWHDALDKVLAPLGLGWRAATGGALEITSATKIQNELQLELFTVSQAGQTLIADLRSVANGSGANQAAAIVYDPQGKVVIASQPASALRAIYRQLRDQNLLDVR